MKTLAHALIVIVALLAGGVASAVDLVSIPPSADGVVDTAGVLGSTRDTLAAKVQALRRETGSEIGILIVPTTQPEAIEQFSLRVAEAWKAGRPSVDDGAILVVALKDRRLRIEVGRGLEGVIPDVVASRIIREKITPRFAESDIIGGVTAGFDALEALVRTGQLPPSSEEDHSGAFIGLIFVMFFIGSVLAMFVGSVSGGVASGTAGFFAALTIMTFSSALLAGLAICFLVVFREPIFWILAQGGGRVGYGGGSGSYGGGGFGSGGVFSGGGASGRW